MLSFLKSFPMADYPSSSRVHPLNSFSTPGLQAFVKRDDELSFGISGSKLRKFRSLIPSLIHKKIKEAVLIGGANSNNVLGLVQLLIENNIKPTLFLRGNPSVLKGNARFLSYFIPSDQIHWINRSEWTEVETKVAQYAEMKKNIGIIPEGAFLKEALPGALTLALDIEKNEKALGFLFDHLFIEAGTGFQAIALLLGLKLLERSPKVHILLLADEKEVFLEKLKRLHKEFENMIQEDVVFPDIFKLYYPTTAASFGSHNREVFSQIQEVARTEGFLTDPVYSAKLFLETKKIIAQDNLKGKALIIHSGGALSLTGFLEISEKTNIPS